VQLCKSLCRSEKLARSLNLQRAAGGAGFDGVGLGGFTKYGGNGGPGGFVSGSAALVAGQTLYIAVGQGGPGGWGASGIQVDGGWGGNTMPTTFGIVNGSGRGGSALAFATGGTGGGRSYILLGPEQADYLNAILVCGAGGGGGSALGIGTRASIGGAGGGLVGGVGIGNGNGVPAQGGTQVGGGAGGTYPGGNDGSPGPLTKGGDNLGSANNGGGAGGGGLFGHGCLDCAANCGRLSVFPCVAGHQADCVANLPIRIVRQLPYFCAYQTKAGVSNDQLRDAAGVVVCGCCRLQSRCHDHYNA
jgi:hypothetical protein